MKPLSKILCLFAILLLYFTSCTDATPNDEQCDQKNCFGVWLDYALVLQYRDNNNIDLLDTDNIRHYSKDSIKIYFLAPDGCIIYRFSEISQELDPDNSFSYAGFDIGKTDQGYVLCLDLFWYAYHKHGSKEVMWGVDSDFDAPRTIYVELNSTDTDTVYAKIEHLCGNELLQNSGGYCIYDVYGAIHYNGELIVSSWEDNQEKMSRNIFPTIIK